MNVMDDGSRSAGYVHGYMTSQNEIAALKARVRALEAGLEIAADNHHLGMCHTSPTGKAKDCEQPICRQNYAALAGES